MAKFKNNRKKKPDILVQQLVIRPVRRQSQDIANWRNALIQAESEHKNRRKLYDLYADVLLDGHLNSIIEKRIKAITNIELKFFNADGEEVEDISQLTEKPFFEKLLREIINSKFWGYSLLELDWSQGIDENKSYLIDRRHVKPELGIVVRTPNEIEGYQYNEPPYINYVVRAGDEKDLGLLLQAAQYAIYKRGGFGDYAEFAEVFGMPFRHATYQNPESKAVLEEALSNMGGAGNAVTPDDVNIKQEYANVQGGSTLHKDFIKVCNDEMSVAILGQTETTTSSASSGYAQSKTHADVLSSIHEDDRQFTLRVLNEELNRVLRNLGYNAEGKWKFIDDENIELKDRIEIDIKVASKVPVADDYFYQKYNIPKPDNYEQLKKEMTERQQLQSAMPNTNLAEFHKYIEMKDEEGRTLLDKIKAFFFEPENINLDEFYHADCNHACGQETIIHLTDGQINTAFNNFINDVYSGNITRNQLHQGVYNETANILIDAVLSGFGDLNFSYDSPHNLTLAHLKSNIYAFSGAKNLEEYMKMRDLLFDTKGNIKPFNKFRDDVLGQVNAKYNQAYLQAEYQTAKAASRSAYNWNKYQMDKDIYPYLQYRTAGDNRVRKEHQRLHGFTAHIDDPVWDKIYPPNGYNCRCAVRQVKSMPKNNPTVNNAVIRKEIPQKYFRTNPGKTLMAFDENMHPYFLNTKFKTLELNAVNNYGMKTTVSKMREAKTEFKSNINSVETYQKWYEENKNDAGDVVFKDATGNYVAFTKDTFTHLTDSKQLKEKRFELVGVLKDIIQNPDEIWSLYHEGKRTGSKRLTQRYIKFYNDKTIIVNVNEKENIIFIKTIYELSSIQDETYRSGILLYKK